MNPHSDPAAGGQPPDSGDATGPRTGPYEPPPLPRAKANLAQVVVPGTAAWFLASVILLFFIGPLREHDRLTWLWTCLAGGVLGLIGLSIYFLQRRAARLGRRSANQMALDEQL